MRKSFFCLLISFFTLTTLIAEEDSAVIVCDNGLEMLEWDLDFIRHATESIDLSACFFGGEVARKILYTIEERLEACPNIKAHILTTPILLEEEDYKVIDQLKCKYPNNFYLEHASNVAIIWPDVTGIDNHIKMCIVDEHYYSIGGTNLHEAHCSDGTYTPPRRSSELDVLSLNLPAGMRDQDIVGRGPIARLMRQTFCKFLALWNHYNQTHTLERNPDVFVDNPYYFEIEQKPFVERFETSDQMIPLEDWQFTFILGGPHQGQNAITNEYARLIREAKNEIKIANLYLCPAEPIFEALLDAVNRGVKLTILTNGISDISPDFATFFAWGNRLSYVPFYQGKTFHFWDYWAVKSMLPRNTHIYEYHVGDVLLHKKTMVIDDHIFLVGSYNLGLKSHLSDYETVIRIDSTEVVKAINQVLLRDIEHSQKVSYEDAVSWYFDPYTAFLGEVQKRFHGIM